MLFTDWQCTGTVISKLLRQLMLKVRGRYDSSFRDFCNSFQSLAAENWKERRPKEVLALGMTSARYLLEHVLRVGVATSELR